MPMSLPDPERDEDRYYADQNAAWSGGDAHVCNCVGCCKKCGHCRTDPKHTAQACKEIQRANEIKREALA
jgi:hypothetical protein